MSVLTIRILLLIACAGHVLCRQCDSWLAYSPKGRFQFSDLKENDTMAEFFDGMSLKNIIFSMLFGVLAMLMSTCGYIGLSEWIRQFSPGMGWLILFSGMTANICGTAHHVLCGVVEWFYIQMNRTEKAREMVLDFFRKTSITMYACYIPLMIFGIAFFIFIITGKADLPQWASIFNCIPLFLILMPFKFVGSGNIANAVMFLGLFFLIS